MDDDVNWIFLGDLIFTGLLQTEINLVVTYKTLLFLMTSLVIWA